jgi:DNA-directed RNA polymerase subunit RPC12/RpoP
MVSAGSPVPLKRAKGGASPSFSRRISVSARAGPGRENPIFFYVIAFHPPVMTHHDSSAHHEHHVSPVCRICSSPVDMEHKASVQGICHHCVYKILIVLFLIMIVISYTAWFGVF